MISAFTFSDAGNKTMYIWSAYYGSRYCAIANARGASDSQGDHPDINGIYNYMSAELCSNRDGTAIINSQQVHHFVAYFGNKGNSSRLKQYHILYEAIDGTYDPSSVTLVSGNDYTSYNLTTWTTNTGQTDSSLLRDRYFYQTKEYSVISNLQPQYQLSSDFEGYELIYSCYNSPAQNQYDIYFFYRPRQYTLTFKYEDQADWKVDSYYKTQSLAGAKKYSDPEKTGYSFLGWYTNEAGAGEPFDFENSTMPAMNLVLYPVMKVLQYMVKIDPNGGVIDHINYDRPGEDYYGIYANNYGLTGSGHNTSQATYFTADYGTPISPYTVERDYIQLSDNELNSEHSSYYTGEKYYYVNMQFNEATDGDWGLPPDLRNSVYLTSDGTETNTDRLYCYYLYYKGLVEANTSYYTNVTELTWDEFKNTYTSYPDTPYRMAGSEHYTFMGWYQVYDNGTEATMPYNFNDPIYNEITLRAKWRLDGGIYVKYNPYFFVENGTDITAVIGEVDQWTDPDNPGSQLYADQSATHILRAPTAISSTDTQDWIFRGWRVVKPEGESSTYGNYTYQKWTPIQKDESGNPVYYSPGEEFIIDSDLVSQNDGIGGIIHMQAFYEPSSESYRRPYVTNIVLDANDSYGGYVNSTDSSTLPDIDGPGNQYINTSDELDTQDRPTQIIIGDLQSNLGLHLYRYATLQTHNGIQGTKLFSHNDGYLLLGFDENPDPNSPKTGKPFIPTASPDSVVAVTRNDNKTLYAMWEPMVYVTFVNTTGEDIDIDLSGNSVSAINVVNEVTGEFDRNQVTDTITVPAKSGENNGQVKIVFPKAVPGTDSITATAVNKHLKYKLSVAGTFGNSDPYGTGSEDVRYGNESTYTGILQTSSTGIVITYTEEEEDSVIFDVNGGTWQESDTSYSQSLVDTDIYTILQPDVEALGTYKPADPTPSDSHKLFLGWTTNAEIAAHTDFSSTTAVTWGENTITPDEDSIILDKVISDYLWDFADQPPYKQTLYAVWSDAVTVTFDVQYSQYQNANPLRMHTWNGPAVSSQNEPYVFYRDGGSRYIKYTIAKGELVPKPEDPTVNSEKSGWSFLRWLTSDANDDCRYNTRNLSSSDVINYTFDFTQRATDDVRLITSWIANNQIRKYTYTVRNEIEGGSAEEEFDYTITAASNMNSSGTYYNSDPNTVLPVTMKLKNNENYTIEVTIVKYNAIGWNHNSLYMVITDRDGYVVGKGHLLEYKNQNNIVEYESSDYQVALTVTQTHKDGYTTSVSSSENETTADIGEHTYTFGTGKGNNVTNVEVTTAAESFTFRSSTGNNNTTQFVGTKQNADFGANYPNVVETITFKNTGGLIPAPTDYTSNYRPFYMMFGFGVILVGLIVTSTVMLKRRKEEEE